ncbi:MAG TPA: hypothetical protein DEB18_16460 [Leeuwenhoekiella sp.]|nr:hypothetical protein [Leeuwenhoekiella sp.]
MEKLSKFLKLNESWNKFLVSEQKTVKMKGSHVCDDESNIKGAFPGDAKLQEAFISLCKLKGDRYWDNTYSWLTGHCLAGDVDSNHSSCIIQAMHVFDNPDQTISQIKSDIKKTLDRGPRSADPNDEASRQKTLATLRNQLHGYMQNPKRLAQGSATRNFLRATGTIVRSSAVAVGDALTDFKFAPAKLPLAGKTRIGFDPNALKPDTILVRQLIHDYYEDDTDSQNWIKRIGAALNRGRLKQAPKPEGFLGGGKISNRRIAQQTITKLEGGSRRSFVKCSGNRRSARCLFSRQSAPAKCNVTQTVNQIINAGKRWKRALKNPAVNKIVKMSILNDQNQRLRSSEDKKNYAALMVYFAGAKRAIKEAQAISKAYDVRSQGSPVRVSADLVQSALFANSVWKSPTAAP